MVNKKIKINLKSLIVLVLTLLSSNICLASTSTKLTFPQLILITDKEESELGRPIRVELYGISLKTKIANIKLNRLSENFGIVTDYIINDARDKRWPNQSIQILKLKLYPRQTGTILIPSISIGKVHSKEQVVRITKGKTGVPKIYLSNNEPYERQQITAHITVTSLDSTSRLSIKEKLEINNFESSLLPFERFKQEDGTYLLQIGLALTALKNGPLKIELPPVEYSVSGVSRKQFYLASKTVNIKALPSYLPPTIPVGKITIKSQLSHSGFLRSDSISYWNVKLSGELNNAYSLPPILRQIKSNQQIKFLPVNSERSANVSANSLISAVNHSIPFKALESGFLKLPKIKLQYFDPISGKIKTVTSPTKDIFVLSFLWRIVLSIFILLIFIYALKISYKKWQQFEFSKMKRVHAMQTLAEGNNIKGIRESIRLLAESEYWSKNVTLSQWGVCWKNKYKVDNDFEILMSTLSTYFYNSKESGNSNKLSSELLALIKNRKKRKVNFLTNWLLPLQ